MASLIGFVLGTVLAQSAGVQDRQAVNRSGLTLGITGLTPVGVILTTVVNRQEAAAETTAATTTPQQLPSPDQIQKMYLDIAGDAQLVAGTAQQVHQQVEDQQNQQPRTAAVHDILVWTAAEQVAEQVEAAAQQIAGSSLQIAASKAQPRSNDLANLQSIVKTLQIAVTSLGTAVGTLYLPSDNPVATTMTSLTKTMVDLTADMDDAALLAPSTS